jgi:hypothetical protein
MERARRSVALLLLASAITGCPRREVTHADPAGNADGGTHASATASATASTSATPNAMTGECTPEPKGGVVIPDSAHVSNIRIAAAGSKALVTFWEHVERVGPPIDTASGHVFDGIAGSLGPKSTFQKNDVGDEPVSEAVPVAVGSDLLAISCEWAAPVGKYDCVRAKPGTRGSPLFDFSGIGSGGPDHSDIAAVANGDDSLVVVSAMSSLRLFSARVSVKKKGDPFGYGTGGGGGADGDALTATLSSEDEATVVFRQGQTIRARRAGFDEKWRGAPIDLSAKHVLVGAPVVAAEPGHVMALFSQRPTARDPWRVVLAEIADAGEVKRRELGTGPLQAQGPGVSRADAPGCFLVSWVEGEGKHTHTMLARMCQGSVVPSSITTLSSDGVEGGRAYLASDPAARATVFAVWQEIPPGKPAELRVARLACR